MNSFFNYKLPKDKPWLILGKGPSFDKVFELDIHLRDDYYKLGLNQVAHHIYCDLTHLIDVECLDKDVLTNSKKIVMPVVPHYKNKPLKALPLTRWCNYLSPEQFLFYNCSTFKGSHSPEMGPIVKAKYFSVEAAFRLLVMQDVKQIYTLGIDGGKKYSKHFADLKPLTNGRKTFDDQFDELNKIVKKWKIEWIKL